MAERPVEADIAIWPLTVVASDNDLLAAHGQLSRSLAAVSQFLAGNGIPGEQVHFQGFSVTDTHAERFGPSQSAANRFIIHQTLVVRSSEPKVVLAASAKLADLVASGVVLQSGPAYGNVGPSFIFTRLNDLKPAMIAEATARAREAGEQFAKDSGAALGRIRRANQGMFQILPRDEVASIAEQHQLNKIVRVVSTVEYFLEE
jgi:hypothetical protein